jgi:ribosome-associated protein
MKVKVRKAGGQPDEPEKAVKNIPITSEFIRLDALLKFASAAQSGGEAKLYIQEGEVTVNDIICTQRGKKIRPGDTVGIHGTAFRIISADKDNRNDS